VQAYQEDLLTLEQLRVRMPDLRARETSVRNSLASLEAQLLDRDTYLKLAENLEGFLERLRDTADAATIEARQKILRSVVKEVLVGRERVVIRHSIPVADHPFRRTGYRLRLRSHLPPAGEHRPQRPRRGVGGGKPSVGGIGSLCR
jgi:site-specific DNA recombinase